MASVQYLYGLGYNVPREIIKSAAYVEEEYKEHHFAAVKIQALWRRYVVRKMIANWNQAATTIQRVLRGCLVRWHADEYYERRYLRVQRQLYNSKATKIQALWRGYCIRKSLGILENIRNQARLRQVNEDMAHRLRELFATAKSKDKEAEETLKSIMKILFKAHHLLRTYANEGILSLHGKKWELSRIEHLMKTIPMTDYMNSLRKLYNVHYERSSRWRETPFPDGKLQKLYELYSKRDKSRDLREETFVVEADPIHKEPFKLDRRPITYAYEAPILSREKYTGAPSNSILRDFDKSKMLYEKDFALCVYKGGANEPKWPPPYYIELLKHKKCPIHAIDYIFD